MFFLLPLAGVAVGAIAGALVTHAAGEKDGQTAEHHRNIANQLTDDYSKLHQRYNEISDKSTKQIDDFNCQLALAEADKDLLRLALRLQQVILKLMLEIDKTPSQSALLQLKSAVYNTNQILSKLNEQLIDIPDDYFNRNLNRASQEEVLSNSTLSSGFNEWLDNLELEARVALAFDLSTPSFILEKLGRDRHAEVRKVVADHPYTPETTLKELANDSVAEVREAVKRNSGIQLPLKQEAVKIFKPLANNSSMVDHLL